MRFSPIALLLSSCAFAGHALAQRVLFSDSLNPCMSNNMFSATAFDVTVTPNNNSLSFSINGVSTITGNVTIDLVVYAYGLKAYTTNLDPCKMQLNGLCPMSDTTVSMPPSNVDLPKGALERVPGIAYTVPDLDASVQAYFKLVDTGETVACVQAELSNGKTVDQKAVAWVVAVISGLALVSSAIAAGLGHSNTAAHVAANAMALFGYFQAQAFIGMTAVPLPPIVSSWTQNFQWSMGIIRVGFIENIATWYQRSTGGTPSTILNTLATTSVQLEKRSLQQGLQMIKRAALAASEGIFRRDGATTATSGIILHGIKRVGFKAGIEPTNIFMTGYIFTIIFVIFVVIGVVIFKLICEGLVKAGHMKGNKFEDFRNGWTTVLKGILFRIVLICYPQMVVLCFWEFTQDDSGAIMVLAIFTVFTILAILAWASSKVIRLAQRSITMHKNPAYVLYSDPVSLNKWGFLYVQFKATAYYFIVPVLAYILVKGMFIALAQSSGTLQAIALVVIEAVFLVTVCVLRPYMDKKINAFNIAICVVNFISAIFLLVFTGIFNQPGIVTGAMGVIFFAYNAIFSTILLIIVLIASVIAIVAKNPDTRYQPMRDDRGSFIKSQTQLNTELDALGATARGETKHGYNHKEASRLDDDSDSWSGGSSRGVQAQQTTSTGRGMQDNIKNPSSMATYSVDGSGRRASPVHTSREHSRPTSYASSHNPTQMRQIRQQTSSPWQRGAGYE